MKYFFIVALIYFANTQVTAQNFSCSGASQYDATYAKAIQPLESVSITLQQAKATKEAERTKSSQSFYAIPGVTSTTQFTSVAANIGFSTCTRMPSFELYKAEVKNGMRTFTLPAGTGGNLAVNVPIQVITPPAIRNPNGSTDWGRGSFKIVFTNGYLQPGEYVLIDKNSLTSDGLHMKGVAFTIK
jgi:hypothetical protein